MRNETLSGSQTFLVGDAKQFFLLQFYILEAKYLIYDVILYQKCAICLKIACKYFGIKVQETRDNLFGKHCTKGQKKFNLCEKTLVKKISQIVYTRGLKLMLI